MGSKTDRGVYRAIIAFDAERRRLGTNKDLAARLGITEARVRYVIGNHHRKLKATTAARVEVRIAAVDTAPQLDGAEQPVALDEEPTGARERDGLGREPRFFHEDEVLVCHRELGTDLIDERLEMTDLEDACHTTGPNGRRCPV
jgi:hypothetical protein